MLCCVIDKKLIAEIKREEIINKPAEKILIVAKRKNTV